MTTLSRTASLLAPLMLAPLMLVACGKKAAEPAPEPEPVVVAAPAPAAAPVAADPGAMTDAQRDTARKQAKLDFAIMEDKYINDARAQWAATATASTSFDKGKSESNLPVNATGAVDEKEWTNDQQNIGFDWIELGYAKPVNATEVRMVTTDRPALESLTKIELQDTDGKWNTVWSGVSEAKKDENGPRTWIVRTFEKTAYKVKAVKYTFANNVANGYKTVEAAQLVGD